MPLELQPLKPADAVSWIRLRALAYYGPTHDVLHNGPIRDSSILGVAADKANDIGTPHMFHWKVIDTDLSPSSDDPPDNGGRTIAVAWWSMVNAPEDSTDENGESKKSKPYKPNFSPPELRLDAIASLFGPLREAQNSIMGTETPYFMLNSFATHPDHQGRGAGSMLLDWGCEKADREGLRTYLDASMKGRPIYEKRGFKMVSVSEWDRKPWGGEGVDEHAHMVREPRWKE